MKLLYVIFPLLAGEILAIYGELLAAKDMPWRGALFGFVSWPLLLWGYWYGYKIGGIWQVTATSLGSIVIAEPILVWTMFREYPGRNALIGCILGALGLVIASVKD